MAAWLWVAGSAGVARARDFISRIEELDHIPAVHPDFAVPNDPGLLFYVQRSSNANTVVYVARPDHPDAPVAAYWRLFNTDGHARELNLAERLLVYGVGVHATGSALRFNVRALPERELTLAPDANGRPAAWTRFAGRPVRLVYVYVQVDEHGLVPSVPWLDLFGVDQSTGRALREHLVPR